MDKKIAVIFIGIQASGKTTFYNRYFSDYVHINLDTLKRRSRENTLLNKCIENGQSFVVDNTNPTREVREKYFDALKDEGYEIHGYFFCSSIEDCLLRNSKRQGRACIPEVGVRATYAKLEAPGFDEGFDKLYNVYISGGDFEVCEWHDNKMDLEKKR